MVFSRILVLLFVACHVQIQAGYVAQRSSSSYDSSFDDRPSFTPIEATESSSSSQSSSSSSSSTASCTSSSSSYQTESDAEYYARQEEEEQQNAAEAKRRSDDDDAARQYDEEQENQAQARRKRSRQEEEQRESIKDILLAMRGYVFTPSHHAIEQLQQAQDALDQDEQAAQQRTFSQSVGHFFDTMFSPDEHKQAHKAALLIIEKERIAWKDATFEAMQKNQQEAYIEFAQDDDELDNFCKDMHAAAESLGAHHPSSEQLAIFAARCEELSQQASEQHDENPFSDQMHAAMSSFIVNGVSRVVGGAVVACAFDTIVGQYGAGWSVSVHNDLQRHRYNLSQQAIHFYSEKAERNVTRAIQDLPKTMARFDYACTEEMLGVLAASYGYAGDPQAQIVQVLTKSGVIKNYVVPASSRIKPYPLPTTAAILKSLVKRDADYLKEDRKKEKSRIAEQAHKLKQEQKARDERVHQKTTQPLQELQNILPNNFQGTKSFFGYYQYDTLGHFIDQHENIWCYDDATHRFDVFNKRKKFQYSVSAKMKAEEPQAPKNKGCGNWQDVDNGPQIFENPGAPAQQPQNKGCGGEKIETKTNTAHDPLPEQSRQLSGCGKPVKTQEQLADEMVMKAEKYNQDTWVGSDGKTRKIGDLRDIDVQYPNNIIHLFDDRDGHLPNSPENQERIKKLVKNPDKYLGKNYWGNWWYGETLSDGTQLWAEVRGEKIINCGLNKTPRAYHPETGFSSPKAFKGNKNK